MKLSHRDQLIALGVVIVLLVVAFAFLLIVPQRKTISRLDGEISQARAEIAEAKMLVGRRQEAKRDAAATEADLLHIANAIPESPEMPSLIIELQDTANEAGLEFVTLAPDEELVELEGYRAASIGLKLRGTWADIVHYTQRMQKLNRELRIVDMIVAPVRNVEGETNPDAAPLLEADLTIQVYTMATDAAATGIPGAPGVTPAAKK